jgi:hypothetical protein
MNVATDGTCGHVPWRGIFNWNLCQMKFRKAQVRRAAKLGCILAPEAGPRQWMQGQMRGTALAINLCKLSYADFVHGRSNSH